MFNAWKVCNYWGFFFIIALQTAEFVKCTEKICPLEVRLVTEQRREREREKRTGRQEGAEGGRGHVSSEKQPVTR